MAEEKKLFTTTVKFHYSFDCVYNTIQALKYLFEFKGMDGNNENIVLGTMLMFVNVKKL